MPSGAITYLMSVTVAAVTAALMVSAFQAYVAFAFGSQSEVLPLFVMPALVFVAYWFASLLTAWPALVIAHLAAARWHIERRLFFPFCGAVLGAVACLAFQFLPELPIVSVWPEPFALGRYLSLLPLFIIPGLAGGAAYQWWWSRRPNPSIEGTSTSGLRPLAAAPHVKR